MRDLRAVLLEAARVLSRLRIRYVIVGGVAATMLGRGRSTLDIDIIAELTPRHAARLERGFAQSGFQVSEEDIVDALAERSHFSVFDRKSDYRLDCKGAYSALERRALVDRRRVRVGRRFVYLDAPENLIVAKLVFGSDQDILDAEAVYVRLRDRLDVRRIERRAAEAGVSREWRRLRRRAERILEQERR